MSGLGLVLSGGGARGAYEAGVLTYVFGDMVRRRRPPKLRVISGTSVGAVNGAFLAATADDTTRGVARLEGMWSQLSLASVMRFGVRQMTGLPRVLLGGRSPTGIFDARPLAELVGKSIPWRSLARNLRKGHLGALIISATQVATGRPIVFVDRSPETQVPGGLAPHSSVRRERIGPSHVLASAAIPLVFPPVQIGQELFCDGGLRLNTPMAPPIHMGMDRLIVIGVSSPVQEDKREPSLAPGRSPGAPFLLGKMLNAFLLDHLNSDLEELERINGYIRDGKAAFGEEFPAKLQKATLERGSPALRKVRAFPVRPSVDIGHIAADHLQEHRARFGRILGRQFLRLLDVGEGADADLASYLLFDGDFARRLVELGRADARAERDALEAFMFDD